MEKIKVGILTDGFLSWGGGVDFLETIINSISSEEYDTFILFQKRRLTIRIKIMLLLLVKDFVALLKKMQIVRAFNWEKIALVTKTGSKYLEKKVKGKYKLVYYYNLDDLRNHVIKNEIKIILPSITPLGADFPCKWIGYIYDFQHKYFPGYFSKEIIEMKDKAFQLIVDQADAILVNSRSVFSDVRKFYNFERQLIALPFSPIVNAAWIKPLRNCSRKIDKKYFVISNQFWKHKDHMTAFKAVKILKDKGIPVHLYCTGKKEDFRFPNYIEEINAYVKKWKLSNNIKFLGVLPKIEQVQLIYNSVALIQPTLFEGGPGGGAVYNALSIGKNAIISDIEINKEIVDPLVILFKHGDANDLAEKLNILQDQPISRPNISKIIENSTFVKNNLQKYMSSEIEKLLNSTKLE
jgi:glycosyltransferase involved in cell wall biosynthesis